MKKYENPMLQVVSIKKSDIIVTSPNSTNDNFYEGKPTLSPGRIFDPDDSWANAGY